MSGTTPPRFLSADDVAATGYCRATAAIVDALRGGLDPAVALSRSIIDVAAGQLLLMPAELSEFVAVKVVSVVPENPARGLPRIVGHLMLLDAATLMPLAIMDGAAVTTLRTPAVSAAAARLLTSPGPSNPPGSYTSPTPHSQPTSTPHSPATSPSAGRMVIFGSGPQAHGHALALKDVIPISHLTIVGRAVDRAAELAARLGAEIGIPATVGDASAVAGADVVVCATTATSPLFRADEIAPGAIVIAVGSHERGVLEMPPDLLARAQVVVEDRDTACREYGEVIAALEEGLIEADDLVPMSALARGDVAPDPGRVRVFKSSGMGWEDAVVAAAVWRRYLGATSDVGQ